MLGSSILDVAIGMAFVYLLLSLIASTIQEALSALVQARSANLERGIRSLFSGGTLTDGKPLVDVLYNHGLIRGLYRDPKQDSPGSNLPTVVDSSSRALLRKFLAIPKTPTIPGVSDVFLLPSYIPARTFAITLVDILNPDAQNTRPPLENIEANLSAMCARVAAADPGATHRAAEAMLALLADAKTSGDATERFRENLENWYNDAMDRVSGWYKRYTQNILLALGLLLAIGFNVDSIRVGQTLWFNKDSRQELASAASAYITNNTPGTANATPGAAPGSASAPSPHIDEAALADHMKNAVRAFDDVSTDYLLPVGWRFNSKALIADYKSSKLSLTKWAWSKAADYDWDLAGILKRIAGWVITALALSFGAPFWFDTLNKFMVVRSTVKPQEKSQNEVSKS